MLFDASNPRLTISNKDTLQWTFNTASARQTKNLGAAFAQAVLPKNCEIIDPDSAHDLRTQGSHDRLTLRIGVEGLMTVGKSTFIKGILKSAGDGDIIEENNKTRKQTTSLHASAGWIRHYDCYCACPEDQLPSYKNKDLKMIGLPQTDIVEHPESDRNNKMFDALILIGYGFDGMRSRQITIAVTPELAARPAFQSFIADNSHRLHKPARPLPGL